MENTSQLFLPKIKAIHNFPKQLLCVELYYRNLLLKEHVLLRTLGYLENKIYKQFRNQQTNNKKVIKSSKRFVTISNDCERHYISGTLKLFVIWVFINIQETDWHDVMTTALIANKPKFVELLLHNGFIMSRYLTNQRLLHIYKKVSCNFAFTKTNLKKQYIRTVSFTLSTTQIT